MSPFDPTSFGRYLDELYRQSRYKSHTEVAIAAGVTRSVVSGYISAKNQSATGKPSRPTAETALKLAKALGADPDTMLLAAGHAPLGHRTMPTPRTPAEFVDRLSEMGFHIIPSGDLSELGPEDLQELIDDIEAKLIFKAYHQGRRSNHGQP